MDWSKRQLFPVVRLKQQSGERPISSEIRRRIHIMINKTSDAVEMLRRHVAGDPEMKALIAEARANREVAQLIYDLRTSAGLTQKDLAEKIGTSQSTIARLEDADYTGHTLNMLSCICEALGRDLELRCPRKHDTADFDALTV